jgi:hypothetical protein
MLQLYLQYGFYNIIFKMESNLRVSPLPQTKNSGCTIVSLHM